MAETTIIRVSDPVFHNTWENGKYTTYKIKIKTTNRAFSLSESCVRRRFSELYWLHKHITQQYRSGSLPQFPAKTFFASRFSTETIETRVKQLEAYLTELLTSRSDILSDTALHLVLQSSSPISEIDDVIQGRIKRDPVDLILNRSSRRSDSASWFEEDASLTRSSSGSRTPTTPTTPIAVEMYLPTDNDHDDNDNHRHYAKKSLLELSLNSDD